MLQPVSIDEYIGSFNADIQKILKEIRETIRMVAPQAKEKIAYGMPAFYDKKPLVYFAAQKGHIGFYPTAEPIVHFAKKLQEYKTSKGAIQFPYTKPIPFDLIKEITAYQVERQK